MVATLLSEQDGEWHVADRRYFSSWSMEHLDEALGGESADGAELLPGQKGAARISLMAGAPVIPAPNVGEGSIREISAQPSTTADGVTIGSLDG
jgi:hypothetical protein